KSEFKIEIRSQGYKEAWKSIKKGDKYYNKGLGAFPVALNYYLKAAKYNDSSPSLNYKIGVCYLATNEFYKATEYLEKAYVANYEVSNDILLMLGRAYHFNLQFDRAIDKYKAYYNKFSVKELEDLTIDIDKLIKECRNGKKLVEEPLRVIIDNLGERINSKFDDYNAILHPNGDSLYFTSRRKSETNDKIFENDYKFYEESYVSKAAGELWGWAKPINKKLNIKNNQAVVGFSNDATKVYVYNGKKNGGDILVSTYEKGKWRRLKKLSSQIRSNEKETSICFSNDGSEMFFISSQKEGLIGGKDIFYSKKDNDGKWGNPINLGITINTPYNEEGVFLSDDENKLYFSSEGHNSMGGYDIFVSEKNEAGIWQDPKNLGYPINTPTDDVFYRNAKEEKQAFISSVRENGFGGIDIYRVIFLGDEKELQLFKDNNFLAWYNEPVMDMFYHAPITVKVDTALYFVGTITDSKSKDSISAKIEIIDTELSRVVATGISGSDGKYKVKIPKKKDYGVEITAKDYLFFVKMIYASELPVVDGKIKVNFKLDKVEVGSKMILKNIFFETNSSSLKTGSYQEIERVVTMLKNNPTIRLEISGHTDNVGSYNANQKLSEARAKSVVEYIVANGIKRGRLEYKGYAFKKPVADNKTEEGRSKNRRVEFEVISK
ncbi:MAG: OmpA family protein, partial [Bacteroidota bacterium]|nr:OmpA family protein [Bacteroidota bacterium]